MVEDAPLADVQVALERAEAGGRGDDKGGQTTERETRIQRMADLLVGLRVSGALKPGALGRALSDEEEDGG